MSKDPITISLDDAIDYYEMSKREISEVPLYCYNKETGEFEKIKSKIKDSCISFINSYELCSMLIDEYLNQPLMKKHKISFYNSVKNSRNKIIEFLWYFEHIDGCYDFEKFETIRVIEELKKWCKINGFNYLESVIYENT